MAGMNVSFICINDCVIRLCLSSVVMLSRVGRTFFKEYMMAMVLRTTPWSKSSSDTFDVQMTVVVLVVDARHVPSSSLPQFSER